MKKARHLTYLIIITSLCLLVTTVVLCDRLGVFTVTTNIPQVAITLNAEESQSSSFDDSSAITDVSVTEAEPETNPVEMETQIIVNDGAADAPVQNYDPDFQVSDKDGVWSEKTEIEIFKISYENASGEITVSGNGDKIIAPGTENLYSFKLQNTGNVGMDYKMAMEAYITGSVSDLPVKVKVSDHNGIFFTGTETSYSPVLSLNNVSDEGSLAAGHYADYTLEWQWPFESGDDEFDTFLGNLAVDKDITLTIVIKTVAVANEMATGGIPQTGDYSVATYAVIFSLMIIAFILLVISIYYKLKKQVEEK